jgi:hypothetical protein
MLQFGNILERGNKLFVERHFEQFKKSLTEKLDPNDFSKRTATKFWADLPGVNAERLPLGKISRDLVFEMAGDNTQPTQNVCVAAMIWGGMDERYAQRAFQTAESSWLQLAEALRKNKLD